MPREWGVMVVNTIVGIAMTRRRGLVAVGIRYRSLGWHTAADDVVV
jgi:hypothetical protein